MVKQRSASTGFTDGPVKKSFINMKRFMFWGIIGLTIICIRTLNADNFYDKYYKNAPYTGWKYIVIHHSATKSGSAASFHRYHSEKGYGGLCYHFVIGNGNGAKDGEIETGFRWDDQIAGTHCTINAWEYNIFGIGICLVGNLEKEPPTPEQMNALVNLTAKLAMEHRIPIKNILGHNNVPFDNDPDRHESTRCPGKYFSLKDFRAKVSEKLKDLRTGL